MADPEIKFYDSSDTYEVNSIAWETILKGQTSSIKTFNIWNDFGGVLGSDTIKNVTITTMNIDGTATGSFVSEKWMQVKCTSYGDTSFTAIGGTTKKAIGSSSSVQTIPSNEKAAVLFKIVVPSTATKGLKQFLLRCEYEF